MQTKGLDHTFWFTVPCFLFFFLNQRLEQPVNICRSAWGHKIGRLYAQIKECFGKCGQREQWESSVKQLIFSPSLSCFLLFSGPLHAPTFISWKELLSLAWIEKLTQYFSFEDLKLYLLKWKTVCDSCPARRVLLHACVSTQMLLHTPVQTKNTNQTHPHFVCHVNLTDEHAFFCVCLCASDSRSLLRNLRFQALLVCWLLSKAPPLSTSTAPPSFVTHSLTHADQLWSLIITLCGGLSRQSASSFREPPDLCLVSGWDM